MTTLQRYAEKAADRINGEQVKTNKAGVDPLTLIAVIIPLIIQLVKLYIECRKDSRTAASHARRLSSPVFFMSRLRVWRQCQYMSTKCGSTVTANDMFDSVIELSKSVSEEDMSDLMSETYKL